MAEDRIKRFTERQKELNKLSDEELKKPVLAIMRQAGGTNCGTSPNAYIPFD